MHGVSNRDTHLYPSHNNSSVYLTATTYVRRSGQITNARRCGWTTLWDSALSTPTPALTLLEWLFREQPGSGSTAFVPVSDLSAPACTNRVWPWLPLQPVNVAQKNKPSTMSSSNVQSIDLPMDCTAWRFWMMRQPNGCSTPVPRSSAAKWMVTSRSNDEESMSLMLQK